MITAKSEPVFGAVYKISAVIKGDDVIPKIKISENVEKITNPGLKSVYRIYDKDGKSIADLITLSDENVDLSVPYKYIDPHMPWKKRSFEGCVKKCLQVPIFKNGKQVYTLPALSQIKDYVKRQFKEEIWEEELRFEQPHAHYIDMSPALYELKMKLLDELG